MTQLWLRQVTTEYAMHKPEGEIWPDTTVVDTDEAPVSLPENISIEPLGQVVIESTAIDGVEVRVPMKYRTDALMGLDGVEMGEIEKRRTHCPRCWEKFETWTYLGTEVAGHQAFCCPADRDSDDRFPRED